MYDDTSNQHLVDPDIKKWYSSDIIKNDVNYLIKYSIDSSRKSAKIIPNYTYDKFYLFINSIIDDIINLF